MSRILKRIMASVPHRGAPPTNPPTDNNDDNSYIVPNENPIFNPEKGMRVPYYNRGPIPDYKQPRVLQRDTIESDFGTSLPPPPPEVEMVAMGPGVTELGARPKIKAKATVHKPSFNPVVEPFGVITMQEYEVLNSILSVHRQQQQEKQMYESILALKGNDSIINENSIQVE